MGLLGRQRDGWPNRPRYPAKGLCKGPCPRHLHCPGLTRIPVVVSIILMSWAVFMPAAPSDVSLVVGAEAATCAAATSPGGTFTDATSTFVGCTITGWADFDFSSVVSTSVALSLLVSGSTVQTGQRLSIAGFAGPTAHQPLNATIVDSTFSNSALRVAGTFPSGTIITVLRTAFTTVDVKLTVGQYTGPAGGHLSPNIFFTAVVLRDGSQFRVAHSTLSNIKHSAASAYNTVTFQVSANTDLTLSNHSSVLFSDTTLLALSDGGSGYHVVNLRLYMQLEGSGNTITFLRCNLTGYNSNGHVSGSTYASLAPSAPTASPPMTASGSSDSEGKDMPSFNSLASPLRPMSHLQAAGITAATAFIMSGCRVTNYGTLNGFPTFFGFAPGTFAVFEDTYFYGNRNMIFSGESQSLIAIEQTQNISILLRGNTLDATATLMRQSIAVSGPAWQNFNLILYRNHARLNNDGVLLLNTPSLPAGVLATTIAVHLIDNVVTGLGGSRLMLQGYAGPHETVVVCRNHYFGSNLVLRSQYASGTGVTDVSGAALRYYCGTQTAVQTQTISATPTVSTSQSRGSGTGTDRATDSNTPRRTMSKSVKGLTLSQAWSVSATPPRGTPSVAPHPTATAEGTATPHSTHTESASRTHPPTASPVPASRSKTFAVPKSPSPTIANVASRTASHVLSATHVGAAVPITPTRPPYTPSAEPSQRPLCPPAPESITAHAWLSPSQVAVAAADDTFSVVFTPPPQADVVTLNVLTSDVAVQWGLAAVTSATPLPPATGAGHCTIATNAQGTQITVTCSISGALVRAAVRARPDDATSIQTTIASGPCDRRLTLALLIQPSALDGSTSIVVVLVAAAAASSALLTAIVDPTAIDAQLITVVLLSARSQSGGGGGAARVSQYLLSPLVDLGPAVVALAHTGAAVLMTAIHLLTAIVTARRKGVAFAAACDQVLFPSASFSVSSVLYAGAAWGTTAAIHSIGSTGTTRSPLDLVAVVCAVCLLLLPEPALCAFALLRTAARSHRFVAFACARSALDTNREGAQVRLHKHSLLGSRLAWLGLPHGAWEPDESTQTPPSSVGSLRGLAGPRAPLLHVLLRLQFLLCCALITAPPQSGACQARMLGTAAILVASAVAVVVTRPFRVRATTALSAALALSTAFLAVASAQSHGPLLDAAIVCASVCAVLRGVHTAFIVVWEHRHARRRHTDLEERHNTALLEMT